MDILRLLEQSSSIKNYQIQDYRHWQDGFYYKLTIHFNDRSKLHAREYIDTLERDYSFHWQTTEDGQLELLFSMKIECGNTYDQIGIFFGMDGSGVLLHPHKKSPKQTLTKQQK